MQPRESRPGSTQIGIFGSVDKDGLTNIYLQSWMYPWVQYYYKYWSSWVAWSTVCNHKNNIVIVCLLCKHGKEFCSHYSIRFYYMMTLRRRRRSHSVFMFIFYFYYLFIFFNKKKIIKIKLRRCNPNPNLLFWMGGSAAVRQWLTWILPLIRTIRLFDTTLFRLLEVAS